MADWIQGGHLTSRPGLPPITYLYGLVQTSDLNHSQVISWKFVLRRSSWLWALELKGYGDTGQGWLLDWAKITK